MKKLIFILCITFACISCSQNEGVSDLNSSLEATLSKNTTWPFEVEAILEIDDTGGYEDSDYPNWAIGSIVTSEDQDGVMIEIGEGVIERAAIDIDSGKQIKVFLGKPGTQYGAIFYPVEKLETLL